MPKMPTIAELQAALAATEKQLAKLQAQRDTLAKQMAEIDAEIAALTGDGRRGPRTAVAVPASRRKRGKNERNLIEYIRDALSQAADGMRVKDIMAAVQKAGYESSSKDFYGLVAAAVRDGSFERVKRGVYKLKAPKAPAKKAAGKKKG